MSLQPHSPEAEKGLLCAFFLDAIYTGRICTEREITAQHFYEPRHDLIFEVLTFLHDQHMEIAAHVVTQMLRTDKKLEQAGGAHYITELSQFIATLGTVKQDAQTLIEKKWLRDVGAMGREFERRSMQEQDQAAKLKEDLQKKMLELCQTSRRRERHNPGAIAAEIYSEWEQCKSEALFGVSTGIKALDHEIGGFCKGDLIIIMGPTSSGKSALAQLIELNFLLRGERVLDNTFEMTAKQRVKRWMQMLARHNLRATMRSQRDFECREAAAFAKAVETIKTFKLEIMDDRGANIRQVCANARNLHSEAPFGLIVTDYDELVKGERLKGASKEEEVASISSMSKTLAGELDCPHVLLSQQTVGANGVAKARWSSGKQNDANILLAIRTEDDGKTATVEILKNREGRRGAEITFDFDGPTTTFKERP